MPKPWRYHDQARELDDELLQEWEQPKVAAEPEFEAEEQVSLQDIIHGDSPCQEIEDIKMAADAMAPELIADHQARQVFRGHLEKRSMALDAFINLKK